MGAHPIHLPCFELLILVIFNAVYVSHAGILQAQYSEGREIQVFLRSTLRAQPAEPQPMQGVSLPAMSSTGHVSRRYVVGLSTRGFVVRHFLLLLWMLPVHNWTHSAQPRWALGMTKATVVSKILQMFVRY